MEKLCQKIRARHFYEILKLLFRHNLLIDAMLKWKTLDYEEIDLLLSKKSLDALQKYRDDNEKKRKQSTGKIFYHFARSSLTKKGDYE